MSKVVDVPGVGTVEFPDTMSDDAIGTAIKQQQGPAPAASYVDQTSLFHPKEAAQGLMQTVLHPLNALHGWLQQNQDLGQKAIDAFKAGDYAGAVRHTAGYVANMVPGVGTKLDAAGDQAGAGHYGDAAATTASLATDLLAGAKAPAVLDAATNPGALAVPSRVAGAALKAGGSDVLKGAGKAGAGLAIAEGVKTMGIPGQLMADMSFAYPLVKSGVRQVGRGFQAGYGAGSDVLATRPMDTSLPGVSTAPEAASAAVPTAVAPPATVGDPEAFAKLPREIQDAIIKGAAQRPPVAPPAPYEPRTPESYGVQPSVHPDPAVRATPSAPPAVGPQAQPGQHPVYGQPLTKLDSDAVQAIAYHEPTQTARVQIKGRDYTLPMTPEMHNRLLAASADPQQSVGKLWNQEIRPTLETKSGVLGPKAATATPETAAPTMEQRLAASPDAVALRNEVLRRTANQHLSPTDLEAVARKTAADINTGRAAGGNARGTIPDWVVADVLKGLRQ